ncbi:16S rRNA (guanine(527)-N(7))-methyltransferase RsmG [Campylobacter sp. MIT 99-7217]|uniref:16S rRNA (guanine(527)-N(7))-methyltransferase RsmG n=1 Tax=Campylobacter sp. MIT 99-7217 TaxID=535091 RepID=UPI00115BECF2|nr:16S rRNA (guanine(527)-N(7))-methyltransferase RsmG [Campylobacter sp. MIT 99-7217]TQR29546.1 16S rRNA (guanine(527)-N(7))-methyltransferase RsmG [Campylobacter sp. MIT 99-7217]
MRDLKTKLKLNLNFTKDLSEDKFDELCDKIELYKQIFQDFNKVHNLSNFKDLNAQIIDSLKILDFKDFKNARIICDIGSGAGFPAVFLALVLKAEFYLFEPNPKKSAFLRSVKITCKMPNLNIIKEKVQHFKADFKADIITSRALMSILNLLEICKNLENENTKFVLFKGSNLKNELQEASKLIKTSEIFEQDLRKYCVLKTNIC